MLTASASGHPGGSLSSTDIVTALFFYKMDYDPNNMDTLDRDRFILSKGHAAPLLYSCLAEAGILPMDELNTLREINTRLQGHPHRGDIPGIEISTGSLGQGLSFSNGVALAYKLDGIKKKVYCLIGDGECQEGQVWEAALTSAQHKLDNLVAITDNNGLQIDGNVDDIKSIKPVADKWEAFGWHTIEIDGHDFSQIISALDEADNVKGKPVMIVANTIKGKGVSFMENQAGWHGKAPDEEQLKQALEELK
jgi:transketolase